MDSLVACTLRGHSGYVFALCACGDRWLCSAGGDGALVLWGRKPAAPCSGAAGACAYTLEHALPAHDGSVLSIAYHERLSLLLSGGADALIRVWDCESPSSSRAPPAVRSLSGHGGAVSALAVTDLLIISGDMVGVCCVWDADSLVCLQTHVPGPRVAPSLAHWPPLSGGGRREARPPARGLAGGRRGAILDAIHALCICPLFDSGALRPAGEARAGKRAGSAADLESAGDPRVCTPPLCFLALESGTVLANEVGGPDEDALGDNSLASPPFTSRCSSLDNMGTTMAVSDVTR
ncbi:WD40-repeat-containing domain protein, partial [Pavlovales sp. CCMP2436]